MLPSLPNYPYNIPIIEDSNLMIEREIIVLVRLKNRGIVIHRKQWMVVPSEDIYQMEISGQTVWVMHPTMAKKLRTSIDEINAASGTGR